MDYVVKINDPILITGQSFKVRYRTLPAGSFGAPTTYTTNEFTLTGLAAGDYEIEIIFNNGTEDCPAIYGQFNVKEVPACWTFSGEFMDDGHIFWIRISWIGSIFPACGYKFYWAQAGASGTFTYIPAVHGGGPVDLIVPRNITTNIIIIADDCDSTRECWNEDVEYLGGCTPLVLTDTFITEPQGSANYWTLNFAFNQSSPVTTTSTITYNQVSVPLGKTPVSGTTSATLPLSPTGTYAFKIFIPADNYTGLPEFQGTFTDACGVVHSWSV